MVVKLWHFRAASAVLNSNDCPNWGLASFVRKHCWLRKVVIWTAGILYQIGLRVCVSGYTRANNGLWVHEKNAGWAPAHTDLWFGDDSNGNWSESFLLDCWTRTSNDRNQTLAARGESGTILKVICNPQISHSEGTFNRRWLKLQTHRSQDARSRTR